MPSNRTAQIALGLVFIVIALVSRFVPHPPNFTGLGALALFAPALFIGAKFPKALAIALPLAVLFATDLVIGFYPGLTFVYLGFALIALMGLGLRPQVSFLRAVASVPVASLTFFVVSNFGVWMTSGMYAKTIAGLGECYLMALPFIGNQLAGDLIFVLGFAVCYKALMVVTAPQAARAAIR